MSDELRGKGAAVPGTASGIGLECARTLHAAGAQVVLIDRDAVRLDELVAEIGSGAYALKNDLLDPAQLYGLMDSVLAIAGGLTIFHANAGSYVESPMVDERLQSAARQVQLLGTGSERKPAVIAQRVNRLHETGTAHQVPGH